jgi:hypothetical protein
MRMGCLDSQFRYGRLPHSNLHPIIGTLMAYPLLGLSSDLFIGEGSAASARPAPSTKVPETSLPQLIGLMC